MPLYPRDKRFVYAALGVVAFVGAGLIVWELWLGPLQKAKEQTVDPQLVQQYHDHDIEVPVSYAYVQSNSPCSGERYELAVERWADAGWGGPALTTDYALADVWFSGDESLIEPDVIRDDGTVERTVASTNIMTGFKSSGATKTSRLFIVHRSEDLDEDGVPDVCDVDNYVLEHEWGHAALGLGHSTKPGSIMQAYRSQMGTAFPTPPTLDVP